MSCEWSEYFHSKPALPLSTLYRGVQQSMSWTFRRALGSRSPSSGHLRPLPVIQFYSHLWMLHRNLLNVIQPLYWVIWFVTARGYLNMIARTLVYWSQILHTFLSLKNQLFIWRFRWLASNNAPFVRREALAMLMSSVMRFWFSYVTLWIIQIFQSNPIEVSPFLVFAL